MGPLRPSLQENHACKAPRGKGRPHLLRPGLPSGPAGVAGRNPEPPGVLAGVRCGRIRTADFGSRMCSGPGSIRFVKLHVPPALPGAAEPHLTFYNVAIRGISDFFSASLYQQALGKQVALSSVVVAVLGRCPGPCNTCSDTVPGKRGGYKGQLEISASES